MSDSASDKTLKIKIEVDQNSLQRAKQALQQLTSSLEKFTKGLKDTSLGNALGGKGGGLLSGGGNGKGGGSAQAASSISFNPVGQAANQLTKSMNEQKQALSSLTSSSTSVMRQLSDSVKRSAGEQENALDSLRNTVDKLTQSYQNLGQAAGGFGGSGGVSYGSKRARNAAGGGSMSGGGYASRMAADGAGGGSIGSGGTSTAPGAPGGGGGGGVLGGIMGAIGKYAGPAALLNMGIGAAATIADEGTRQYTRYSQNAADRAGVWQSSMRRAASGDLTLGLSQHYMNIDPDAKALAGQIGAVKMAGGIQGATGGSLGGFLGNLGNPMAAGRNIMNGTGDVQANTALMAQYEGMRANKEKENAVEMMYASRFQDSMAGKFSWMHATGQDYKYGPDRSKGAIQDRIGIASATRAASGFTDEEYMGSFGQVQGVAGRGAANRLASASMYGVASGIGNAGTIAGQAAVGGGYGSGFMGYLYGAQGGAGGYDPGALGMLGGGIQAAAQAGGVATSGTGALNSFLAGAGGGSNGPGDMLSARNMLAGLGAMGTVTSGSMDRFQSGRNILNASSIMGAGSSAYGIDQLANKMTPTQMLDIMHGGSIDPKLAAMGISRGNVSKMFDANTQGMFGRYNDSGGTSSMDTTMRAFRASGKSVQDFVGGSSDKKGTRAALAAALSASNGMDLGAAEGALDGILGAHSKAGRFSGARGVSGGKSPEAQAAQERLEAEKHNLQETLDAGKKLVALNKDMDPMSRAFQNFTSNLSTSADGAAAALRDLEAAAASLAVAQGGAAAAAAVNRYMQQYKGKRNELIAKANSMGPGLERAEMLDAANKMGGSTAPSSSVAGPVSNAAARAARHNAAMSGK